MIDQRQVPPSQAGGRRAISTLAAVAASLVISVSLAGCGANGPSRLVAGKAEVDPKLGVAPSPRVVAAGEPVPKGGGRAIVGKPYTVAGKRYVPRVDPDYERVGLASWYGDAFHGRKTANGEIFDSNHLSAAHPTMPLPSYARVTSLTTGRSVVVRVNDRGPFHSNRLIDISRRTAEVIGVRSAGIARVKVEYVGPAPVQGDDTEYLMASYRGPGSIAPLGMPETMVASAAPLPGVTRSRATAPAAAPAVAPMTVAPTTVAAPAAIPAGVLPPVRPVLTEETYVVVASADPADAYLTGNGQVQLDSATTVTPNALYTPASFQVGAQPVAYTRPVSADPIATPRSSYAADRVDAAYAAVDQIGEGVALSELASRLRAASSPAEQPSSGATVQVGIFADAANAARVAAALAGIGEVAVDDLTVNGRALKRVRLSALAVSVEDAVAAAERAGARGAVALR